MITYIYIDCIIVKPIKDIFQSIIDAYEETEELIAELKNILDDKEKCPYVFYQVNIIIPQVKYKRFWKRQKIP